MLHTMFAVFFMGMCLASVAKVCVTISYVMGFWSFIDLLVCVFSPSYEMNGYFSFFPMNSIDHSYLTYSNAEGIFVSF